MAASSASWTQPLAQPVLSNSEVHVWRASLEQSDSAIRNSRKVLSPDEICRADRFHRLIDCQNFIVVRAVLRIILSRYLAIEPHKVEFSYTQHGKPVLCAASSHTALEFNVSHSKALAVYAIARSRKVGIDIEQVRGDLEYERIAERFFAPQEIIALQKLPCSTRTEAFFAYWTCKEAFVKATGQGLTYPFNEFSVSVNPASTPELLEVRGDIQDARQWCFHRFIPATGYIGTLAVEAPSVKITHWQYQG